MAIAYMERPDGTIARVRFSETAHIPGFHTSCISVKRLKQRGVYWNTYTNMLEHNRQPIYRVQDLHHQFLLEFNNGPHLLGLPGGYPVIFTVFFIWLLVGGLLILKVPEMRKT